MTTTRPPALLAVFAHPDDEVFFGGILSHMAARGVRVQLLILTHGDAGKVRNPALAHRDLVELRTEELQQSCRELGIAPPRILDFHDSGRGERLRVDDPRALVNVDVLEAEGAIREVIHIVKPQVMITHDAHGGYMHPDHVATFRAVSAAFYSSGSRPEAAPCRLFHIAMSLDVARDFSEATRGKGPGGGVPPEVLGTPDSMIACSFDARPYVDRKFRALAAHSSQFGITVEMLSDPPPPAAALMRAFRPVFEKEVFTLGAVRGTIPSWPLKDLFEGLDGATTS